MHADNHDLPVAFPARRERRSVCGAVAREGRCSSDRLRDQVAQAGRRVRLALERPSRRRLAAVSKQQPLQLIDPAAADGWERPPARTVSFDGRPFWPSPDVSVGGCYRGSGGHRSASLNIASAISASGVWNPKPRRVVNRIWGVDLLAPHQLALSSEIPSKRSQRSSPRASDERQDGPAIAAGCGPLEAAGVMIDHDRHVPLALAVADPRRSRSAAARPGDRPGGWLRQQPARGSARPSSRERASTRATDLDVFTAGHAT
jgi:hypothetical protein